MQLTHCQCPDDPTKCKGCFPRAAWKVNKTLLLYKGFLKERKMPHTGKKNLTGAVHGPMNEENLNGCIPSILAGCPGLNFNNDIQMPYRFPILDSLHASDLCKEKCWNGIDETEMIWLCKANKMHKLAMLSSIKTNEVLKVLMKLEKPKRAIMPWQKNLRQTNVLYRS